MEKNKKTTWDTRTLVFMALLVAMNIVLARQLVIDLGFARITVGSVCTILAGLWFGPAAGGVCGLTADLLGCLLKGYAVNPLITIAAILWGVVPALVRLRTAKANRTRKMVFLCLGIAFASILSTLVFTTAGLVLINGYNFYAIMPSRMIQWAVMTPVYCAVTCAVYFSPITSVIVNGNESRRVA
ncbi:MAG: folate family ECF transporter S component [Eubacteriales bacterium]|nr:folate family ECF transporter S component [Eubacteriales bacterium]